VGADDFHIVVFEGRLFVQTTGIREVSDEVSINGRSYHQEEKSTSLSLTYIFRVLIYHDD
jgi:hypothetical protein